MDRTRLSWGNGSGIVTVGFCRSPDSGVGEGSTVGAPNHPKVRPYDRMIYWYSINKIICLKVECRSYRMGLMKAYVLIWRFMIQDVNACDNSTWHDAVWPVVGWHEDLGFIGTPERLAKRRWVRLHTWSTQGCLDLRPYDVCEHGCPISFQLLVWPVTRPGTFQHFQSRSWEIQGALLIRS